MIKNAGIVLKKLKEFYENKSSMLGTFNSEDKDEFFILISTILSARAKDETTEDVSRILMKRYPTPKALANAEKKIVEKIIKRTGFYKQKTKYIIETSKIIHETHKGKVPDKHEHLIRLPGVGNKVAACVLVYAFNKNDIPVDVHVQVIAQRLGWTKEKTPDKIQQDLKKNLELKYWQSINELFVVHGKAICDTRRPKCGECPIRKHCNYYKNVYSKQ